MKAKQFPIIAFVLLHTLLFNAQVNKDQLPEITKKTPIRDSVMVMHQRSEETGERKDSEEIKRNRKLWIEQAHRAAPGVSWRAIEEKNLLDKYNANKAFNSGNESLGIYANGQLCGNWAERGSSNQAGRCVALDYYPADNSLYIISNSGSMFQGVPDVANWTPTNNQLQFKNNILKVLTNTGGTKRIIAAVGLNTFYSDDNGATFNPSSGLSFPVEWGGNYIYEIESLTNTVTNATTLYLVTRPWDPGPWSPRFWLYTSTDKGQTWTYNSTFPVAGNDNQLHLTKPAGQENYVYALFNSSLDTNASLYSLGIAGDVSVINTFSGIPVNTDFLLTSHFDGAATTLYMATLTDNVLFKTSNQGTTWSNMGALPTDPHILAVSPNDPTKIFTGQVNGFRSYNSGTSWILINEWYEYNTSPTNKLHADIFNLKYFKRTNGTSFAIINTDGGAYRSIDDFQTVSNISMTGLNNSEYYSVISDAQSNLYLGSQDQGLQRVSDVTTNTNVLPFTQIISGDYGKLQLTRNGQTLWAEYPGGNMYYYYTATGGYTTNWSMSGTTLPTASWMLATARVYPASLNQIYLAGGNINGGTGSYLIKLTGTSNTITATQGTYDFRGSTTSGISALATTPLNTDKIYVAKEDGSFYYSGNSGTVWTQTASFSGPAPQFLFGNCIFASKLTPDFVLLGGSGYSNPGVYKSVNGGLSFTAMSNGLPPTLVYGFAANAAETFIYAATEAGPYVFSVADNTWYPLNGGITPAQTYFSVDYDTVNEIAHFASYGRGVWDFKVCPNMSTTAFLKEKKFSVYPNPTSGKITFLLNQIPDYQLVDIYDVTGKMVMEVEVSNKSEVELSGLSGGMYVVKLKNYPQQSQKIIKE